MPILYRPVCMAPRQGDFLCVLRPICLPNVGHGYNYITLFVNCNSLSAKLAQWLVPLWGGPARSSPLYHFGLGAEAASLLLSGCSP